MMRLSELIERLQILLEHHGDLKVAVVTKQTRKWRLPRWVIGKVFSVGISGRITLENKAVIYGDEDGKGL